ncbi:MAG: DUF3327 domain-containing protein [Ilumatobacteraceae bacterium]
MPRPAADRELDAALARLWSRPRPLVEAEPDCPGRVVVTFLWRGRRVDTATPDDDVYVLVNRLTRRDALDDSRMSHVPGTDVWWRSWAMRDDWRATYQFAPRRRPDGLPVDTAASRHGTAAGPWRVAGTGAVDADADVAVSHATIDPGNPRTLPSRWGGPPMSLVALDVAVHDDVWDAADAHPQLHEVTGPDGRPRRVWCRAPEATGCRLLVVLDGQFWGPLHGLGGAVAELERRGEARPTVVVMVDSVDDDVRRHEYDGGTATPDWLAGTVVEWARQRWSIGDGPEHVTIAGQSLGGLTAIAAGHHRPDVFGSVAAQSPSLWWPAGSEFDVEAGAIVRDIARGGRRSTYHDLAVGLQEPVLLPWARHLRDVLAAAQMPHTYREVNGGHDFAWWRDVLVSALRR